MPGLLERAQKLVALGKKAGRNVAGRGRTEIDDSGVSADERKELLGEIETLFVNRTFLKSEKPEARRGGGAIFPLVVNIAAVVLLGTAVFAVGSLHNGGNARSGSDSAHYLATEGLVVRAVKKQAAAELGQREARIAQIERELAGLKQAPAGSAAGAGGAREKQLESELALLRSNANAHLSALALQQQQQAFLIRQLQSIYQNIQSDVQTNDLSGALAGISSADRFLKQYGGNANGEVAAVAPALSSGNAVLRTALLFGQSAMNAAKTSELSRQVAEIGRLVQRGNDRYDAGDMAGARALYTKAVTSLSSVGAAYERLTAMSKDAYGRQIGKLNAELDKLVQQVDGLKKTIDTQQATLVDQRGRLARQNALLSEQNARISEQLAELSAERLAVQKRTEELAAVVKSIQQSIAQAATVPQSKDGAASASQVVDLLKTKVAIRSLAESPEARRSHPQLSSELDPFFRKYAQTYNAEGRQAALNQVASALNDVLASLNPKLPATSIAPSASPVGQIGPAQAGFVSREHPITGYLGNVNRYLDSLIRQVN